MLLSRVHHVIARNRWVAIRRVPAPCTVAALSRPSTLKLVSFRKSTSIPCMWMARRLCSTESGDARHTHDQTAPLASDDESHSYDASTATPPRDMETERLVYSLEQVGRFQSRLVHHFVSLPLDRRVLYRDHLLQDSITPYQQELKGVFLALQQHVEKSSELRNELPPLTRTALRHLKAAWLTLKGLSPTHPKGAALNGTYIDEIHTFYSALLCSGVLTTESDVRLALEALQSDDLLEPSSSFYESLFIALWTFSDVQRTTGLGKSAMETSAAGCEGSSTSSVPPDLVAGEAKRLHRGLVGDLACHYMGHALAQQAPPTQSHVAVRRETWEAFFCTFANAQPAPMLMDLWWTRFLKWVDNQHAEEHSSSTQDKSENLTSESAVSSPSAPLPYQAVHAVLAWCAQSRDMERALKFFNVADKRGITLHASTTPCPALPLTLADSFGQAGSLTALSTNPFVQQLQLALLVKLMASTKSVRLDGGLRALVVRDLQRQIVPAVLYTAPWGVLNDLLSGLSVPSAMQLLRRCSLGSSESTREETRESHSGPMQPQENTSEFEARKGRDIPFYIWASLLRRCCREHLQDQAESLFSFLRHKFRLATAEKRELVEIMMRMYVTMQPSDFPSALDLFLQHVLRTPPEDPVVQPDGVLYELLVKGADSRNASMMLFLEACANGVPLTAELFEALMGSTQFTTVASLSRKLPHDYANSSLDAQLKIPAEADAHLRREEALRARGKLLYDSTGDAS